MPKEVRIEAIEYEGSPCWLVRLGHRGLRFAREDLARAFAAQLHARRQWLRDQDDSVPPRQP